MLAVAGAGSLRSDLPSHREHLPQEAAAVNPTPKTR